MKKSKLLTALFALFIFVPCAFLFVACGGNKDQNKDQEKTVSSIMVSVASNSKYYQYYDGERFNLSSTDWDFTKDDFVVKILYSDGSEEESLNYTLYVDEDFSWQEINANCYNIHFIYGNQEFANLTIKVVIEDEILPSLTGISKVEDTYYLDKELRYTGAEQNPIGYIGTENDGVTLQTLIDENKVNVSSASTIVATDANVYNNGVYDYNTIMLEACDGYTWEIENQKVKDIVIKWNIKRQILDNPTVTSLTEYTYAYTDQNGYIEGVERGLTFDYKGNDDLIYSNDSKVCDAGEYTWKLQLYDDGNYAFLSGGKEVDYLEYDWKINPQALSVNAVEISDTANESGEYRYTYTGSTIKPTLNIDDGVADIFNVDYGNSGGASSNAYNVLISVDTNLDYDSNGLINFVWANGNAISIYYEASLPFFIDKKQVEAPSGFNASNVAFLGQEYCESGNYLYNFNLTREAEYTSFTSETLSYLNNLQMLNNNAVFKWQNQNQSLSVGNDNKAVLYWYSNSEGAYEDNYIPLEIMVTVTINKAKAVVSPYWEQDSNTSVYSIKRLNNSKVEGLVKGITYTYYYGESDYSTTNVATNLTDAGYYTVVANLPTNGYYELVCEDSKLTKQWTIEKRTFFLTNNESEMWSLSDGTSSTNNLDSYYYENEGNAVNKVVSINEAKLTVDAQSLLNVTTTHYFLNGSTLVETTNCSAVGQYKTVATFTFKEGYKASNYIVNGVTETENGLEVYVIWNIYPNAYTLVTNDSNADNYIGWPIDVQTEFIYDGTAKQPEIENVPSGLEILYDWSDIDDVYTSDANGRSDVGTYLIKAYFAVDTNLLGYNKVTVTIDGKTYLEAGQRVEYNEGVEVVPRREVEANGYFYYIGSLEYKIYQENFFTAGKTFTITDVTARTTDGSAVPDTITELTKNNGKTMVLGENSAVSGTCDLGEGVLNEAEEGTCYVYSVALGTLTVGLEGAINNLVGGMINSSTLWLIKQVDTNTQIIYVFTIETGTPNE